MDMLDRFNESLGGEVISPKDCQSPSLAETLKRRKQHLEADLANVTGALEALEKNPEVARVLELVARAR